MVRSCKKAYVRTVEAMIAIVITFVFIAIIFPRIQLTGTRGENVHLLTTLEKREDFRNCVIKNNGTCVNSTIAAGLPLQFDYKFNISADPNVGAPVLPAKRVFADSVYVAGNASNRTDTIVRLYYFAKS